jgi:hypothetical protein
MNLHRAILMCVMLLLGAAIVPVLVLAQYRVNNQIYGTQGSVRFASSIAIPSATYATPSQVRMAVHASGATPSQLKTEYNRIGPLAPSGAIAYVPPAQNVFTKSSPSMPQGNYMNTRVAPGTTSFRTSAPQAAPPGNPFATGAYSGSIRYTAPSAASYQQSVTSWSSLNNSPAITGQPSSFSSPVMSGSVKYSQ